MNDEYDSFFMLMNASRYWNRVNKYFLNWNYKEFDIQASFTEFNSMLKN